MSLRRAVFLALLAWAFSATAWGAIPPQWGRPAGMPPAAEADPGQPPTPLAVECLPFLHLEKDLALACEADLSDLDLAPKVRADLEEKRFRLRVRVIRGQAEFRVLEMELSRLTASRSFDPKAAKKKLSEVADKIEDLRGAHLEFLAELAAALTDDQWAALRDPSAPQAEKPEGAFGPRHHPGMRPECAAQGGPQHHPGMRPECAPQGGPQHHQGMRPECRPMPPPAEEGK